MENYRFPPQRFNLVVHVLKIMKLEKGKRETYYDSAFENLSQDSFSKTFSNSNRLLNSNMSLVIYVYSLIIIADIVISYIFWLILISFQMKSKEKIIIFFKGNFFLLPLQKINEINNAVIMMNKRHTVPSANKPIAIIIRNFFLQIPENMIIT